MSRPRLLTEIVSGDTDLVLIDAPMGFGKTTLLHDLAASAPSHHLTTGLELEQSWSTLREALIERGETSMLVLVDDAERAGARIVDLLHLEATRTVVAADRVIGLDLRRATAGNSPLELGADDLRFDRDEMAAVCRLALRRQDVDALVGVVSQVSEGWPAAVRSVLRSIQSGSEAEHISAAAMGPNLDELCRTALDQLDAETAGALRDLCHLDAFTSSCLEALAGRDAVNRARRAGFPLLRGDDGWLRAPTAVTTVIRSGPPMNSASAQSIAPVLIASGGLLQGVSALLTAGCLDEAGDALCALPRARLDEADQRRLLSILDLLEPVSRSQPRLHLCRARVHRNLANFAQQQKSLEVALEASLGVDRVVELEARLELLYLRATSMPDVDDEYRALQELDGEMTVAQRVRLLEVGGLLESQAREPERVEAAVDMLTDAANRWDALGEPLHSASCLRTAATAPLMHLGDYTRALDVVKRAQALSWRRLFERALDATLLCRLDVLCGRTQSFEPGFSEARMLVRTTGLSWLEAYLDWAEMLRRAAERNLDLTRSAIERTKSGLGGLSDHPTGVVFDAEATIALAQLGQWDEARQHLERARDRRSVNELEVMIAELVFVARQHDRQEVERQVAHIEASGLLPDARRWRIEFERSLVASSLAEAEQRLSEARRLADDVGLGAALELLQRDGTSQPKAAVRVSVLGRFAIEVEGAETTIADGKAAGLLKYLAVEGPQVSVDAVVDVLWPDETLEVGRRRLKNVVSRLRRALGDPAVRRERGRIALTADVCVDYEEFNRLVTEALDPSNDEQSMTRRGVNALQLSGPLLPDDLFEAWTDLPREHVKSRSLVVLSKLMSVAQAVRPPAPWLLDTLLRIAPEDDQLLLSIARLAMDDNEEACARSALELAVEAARDLGIDIASDVEDLRELLRTR